MVSSVEKYEDQLKQATQSPSFRKLQFGETTSYLQACLLFSTLQTFSRIYSILKFLLLVPARTREPDYSMFQGTQHCPHVEHHQVIISLQHLE